MYSISKEQEFNLIRGYRKTDVGVIISLGGEKGTKSVKAS
jgi:hypothetical protein